MKIKVAEDHFTTLVGWRWSSLALHLLGPKVERGGYFYKYQISKGRIFFRNIYQLCDGSQLCNQDCSSHYNLHSPDIYNLQFTCLNQTSQSLIGGNQV